MPLPQPDPSNPALPAPLFADVDAVRGDHLRANNQLIWENLQYLFDFTGRTTDMLTEGATNLYYTDVRAKAAALAAALTGFATGANSSVSASDTILQAFAKVQGQLDVRAAEYGLTLSNSSGKILAVAAGKCADSTRSTVITLSAFTGSLAGTFTAGTGNNKLDTGTVANSTTYHVFVISKANGASPDILFSLSPTAPTMPSTYTLFRRIGSLRTDGSGNWVLFTQYGNEFLLSTPVKDQTWTNSSTAALQTLTSIPTGVKFGAHVIAGADSTGGNNVTVYISSPDQTDLAAAGFGGTTDCERASLVNPASLGVVGSTPLQITLRTNTSSQIRARASNGVGSTFFGVRGWIDYGISGLGV